MIKKNTDAHSPLPPIGWLLLNSTRSCQQAASASPLFEEGLAEVRACMLAYMHACLPTHTRTPCTAKIVQLLHEPMRLRWDALGCPTMPPIPPTGTCQPPSAALSSKRWRSHRTRWTLQQGALGQQESTGAARAANLAPARCFVAARSCLPPIVGVLLLPLGEAPAWCLGCPNQLEEDALLPPLPSSTQAAHPQASRHQPRGRVGWVLVIGCCVYKEAGGGIGLACVACVCCKVAQ